MENVQSLLGTIKTETFTFDESLFPFKDPGKYFKDGKRLIDLVFAWKETFDNVDHNKDQIREHVQKKLQKSGFDIEVTPSNNIVFIKLHVEEKFIYSYAQTLGIRPPVKVRLNPKLIYS